MRKTALGFLAALLIVFGVVLEMTLQEDTPTPALADGETAKVERVVDGDTLIVHSGGDRLRLRLLNIDAPELARDGQPEECMGSAAAQRLEELAPVGSTVTLVYDKERQDQYGRDLAAVFDGDVFVNEVLAEEGLARAVVYQSNDTYYSRMQSAEAAARQAQLGMFSPECHAGR